MAVYFNPPPNWPAPPSGWAPPDDWRPDPTWPLPPRAWSLFAPLPWLNTLMRRGIKMAIFGLVEAAVTAAVGAFTNQPRITGWGALGGVILWVGIIFAVLGVFVRLESVREAREKDRRLRSRR